MNFEKDFATTEARYKLAQQIVNEFDLLLAAVAWKRFQKLGKGYVVVSPENVDGKLIMGNINYVIPDENILNFYQASTQGALPTDQGIFEIVEIYNPEESYVMMVDFSILLDKIEKVWFHRMPQFNPKISYELVKIQPQKFGFEENFD